MNEARAHTRGAPRLVWAHRGVGTDLWLRLELPEPATLAARLAGSDGPLRALTAELGPGYHDVTLPAEEVVAALAVLAVPAADPQSPTGTWELLVDADTALIAAPDAVVSLRGIPTVVGGAALVLEVRIGGAGAAQLRVTERAPWLEVASIDREGPEVAVRGTLRGITAPGGPGQVTAALVDRDTGSHLPVPVGIDGAGLRLGLDLAAVPAADVTCHRNVVLDVAGRTVRAAGFEDDLVGKHRLVLTDPVEGHATDRWWTTTLRFTDRDNLVVTTTAARPRPPGDPLATWEVEQGALEPEDADDGPARGTGHRVLRVGARALFQLLSWWSRRARRRTATRGRGTSGDRTTHRVHLLLANLHAAGGTVRATANLANALAARGDTEVALVSVYRLVRRRYVTLAPEVRTRVLVDEPALDDHPGTGPAAWLKRRLRSAPSVLIPADDPRAHRFSLLSDVQLVRWLRGISNGTIVTTRAGLSVTAARFARPGVRVVAQQHVPFETQTALLRSVLVDSYRRTDAVCVLTEADARLLRGPLSDAGTLVRVLPNPLEEPPGGPPEAPLTAPRIICGGRVSPVKGTDLLLAAFARLAEAHPDWELRIHGSARADRLAAAQHLVRTHQLHDRVRLLPPTPRFELELAKASICAVPSRHEAFGMVVIEALQAGVPVVAFDCPVGPGEILTDGHDGLLVPPEDVDGFAAALATLMTDAERRHQLAHAGRRRATDFAPDRVAAAFVELLDELGPST
jgi:glycosyltransferase involved in cell wall biosynthesis